MIPLEKRVMQASQITEIEDGWRLAIDSGPARKYRWAQLDDYAHLERRRFAWTPPLTLRVRARISDEHMAGTWGFGFWNDPFSFGMGPADTARRLPALPNAAWFFYASPPNYLALHNDHPAQGFLAATFRAPLIPLPFFAPGLVAAPLLFLPPAARLLRRLAALIVREAGALVPVDDLTAWHDYQLELLPRQARFFVDGNLFAKTATVPRGRLGFVLWIDNQFAAFTPAGRLSFGTLANPNSAWLEVQNLAVEKISRV